MDNNVENFHGTKKLTMTIVNNRIERAVDYNTNYSYDNGIGTKLVVILII